MQNRFMSRALPRFARVAVVVGALAVTAACESLPLLAPSGSTITVSADNRVLPPNGSTGITAFVSESGGTPVQNGTTVRFSVTAGRIEPVEAQTRNGTAEARFFADGVTGTVTVRAVSGAAGAPSGGTGGQTATASNSVEITIQSPPPTGAAAAADLVVAASPRQLPSSGGTVSVTATAVDSLGQPLADVPVRFSTTTGTLSSTSATTNAAGNATVTLSTTRTATVTATITVQGTGTNPTPSTKTASAEIVVAGANSISIAASPNPVAQGAPVTLTVTPTLGQNNTLPRVVVIWGDGSQDDLGPVPAARTVSHVYTSPGNYTISATARTDGESPVTASTIVAVNPRPPVPVTVTATPDTPTVNTPVRFVVTAGASGDTSFSAGSYRWEFRSVDPTDNETITTTGPQVTKVFRTIGEKRVDVTVTATDGRTGTGQTAVVVRAAPVTP